MGDAIKVADGVIFITPEYNYSVPGALKNALDWLSRLPSAPFVGKPVAIQSVSPSPIGGTRCQHHLRQILVFLDAKVLNKPEVAVGGIAGKFDVATGAVTDRGVEELLTRQLLAFTTFAGQQRRVA